MHTQAYMFVASKATDLRNAVVDLVVEIGSRNINGTIRPMFDVHAKKYIGVDVSPGDGVDVVADGATYRPPVPADVVVCCEVLEHAPNARQIVENAVLMLRGGGMLILTAAGEGRAPHSAVDGGRVREGEFYRNVTRALLRKWLEDAGVAAFEITVDDSAKDIYAWAIR
jgi:hypothetical protein